MSLDKGGLGAVVRLLLLRLAIYSTAVRHSIPLLSCTPVRFVPRVSPTMCSTSSTENRYKNRYRRKNVVTSIDCPAQSVITRANNQISKYQVLINLALNVVESLLHLVLAATIGDLESRNNGVGSFGMALPPLFPGRRNLVSRIDLNLEPMVFLAILLDRSRIVESESQLLEVGLGLGKCGFALNCKGSANQKCTVQNS